MDEIPVTFFANSKVEAYLRQMVRSGLYGGNVADAVERIVSGSIEDMIVSGLLEEIPAEEVD
jgi:hypothetical protein